MIGRSPGRVALSAAVVVLAAFVAGPTVKEIEIGTAAPLAETALTDLSGGTQTLRKLAGRNGLLVIFSSNTCPYVAAWESRYGQAAEQAKALGVGMAVLNANEAERGGSESLDAMKRRAQAKGYTFPYLVDHGAKVARAFGATRTPHVFLFDKDLRLVYRGAIDDNSRDAAAVEQPYLANAMQAMVAGQPVDPNTTRSIGCGIKFD